MRRTLSIGSGFLAVVVIGLAVPAAWGNVYPSGLNAPDYTINETCEVLALRYVVNEQADGYGGTPGLKVEVRNSSSVVVRTLTSAVKAKGVYTFLWDGRDDSGNRVANGTYTVKLITSDDGYAQVTQISEDSNVLLQFENARSIAVNTNPNSPRDGRIYINEKRDGVTATGRSVHAGLYQLNADQSDVFGEGDTSRTGGLTWPIDIKYGFRTIEVGQDDNIYIGDHLNSNSNIYRVDGDVTFGSGVAMLQGVGDTAGVHGSIASSVVAEGSLGAGNLKLWAVDEDGTGGSDYNALFRWDVNGSAIPFGGSPVYLDHQAPTWIQFAQPIADLDRGPDGKFYMIQNRAANQTQASLFVLDSAGTTVLWNSLDATRTLLGNPSALDMLLTTWSVKVSPDGAWVAVFRQDVKCFVLPLVSGIPDLANAISFDAFTYNLSSSEGADVAWDRANNLYFCDYRDGGELVRIFSLGTGAHSNSTTSKQVTLNKSGSGGPTIVTQPQDASGYLTTEATFSVVASGGSTYQWWKNGMEVSGAGQASYTVTNLTEADDGSIVQVVVCDANGVRVSREAVLTVQPLPACPNPFANTDGDNDVDQIDFGVWQRCYTGSPPPPGSYDALACSCFDRDNNQAIDSIDFQAFANCWSGPNVPLVDTCDDTP